MVLGKFRLPGTNGDADEASGDPNERYPLTFAEMLDENRRAWGDKIAFQQKIKREWQRFSHNETYAASYEVAAGLTALGLRPGDRVVLILENSFDWIRSYYGIVLAGGVTVPIYYDLKDAEISEMIAHADPMMAIVSAKAHAKLSDALSKLQTVIVVAPDVEAIDGGQHGLMRTAHPAVLSLDDAVSRATSASREAVSAHVIEPDDLASIMFTSGTSGGSKGVMLTHRNFLANCRQIRRSIPFNDSDRMMIVLPLHHAFPFIIAAVVAPSIGGEVTFENDLRRIRDRMAEVKPTLFQGVPALFEVMYRNIVHSIEVQGRMETFQKGLRIAEATKQRTGINIGRIVFRELHKRLGGSIRFMVNGGAALNPQTARDFAALGIPIIQGWGLSEAAPVLTAQRWNPRKFYMSNYYEEHFGSIGEAVEDVEIGLIDVPEKELYVHLHGEGELVARGANVTQGYWRAPEATSVLKVGGWLRTGDIGRIDEDGQVWLTGRSKFVIVLDSGEKVHPDEVEEKIERSPLIQDVAVLGRKARGKMQVAAVVYPNRDAIVARIGEDALNEETVRRLVQADIAEQEADVAPYKRTMDVMLTDEPLPRTPIRKVMRGHLRDSYGFDLARWQQSWKTMTDATNAATAPDPEADAEEALSTA